MLKNILNIPTKQEIVVLNKPEIFANSFDNMNYTETLMHSSCVDFAIVFVKSKHDFINQMMTLFPRILDSSELWVVFPVNTTKKELASLHIEFDWDFLGDYRLQPMRQVSINNLWKAIKLRKAKFE